MHPKQLRALRLQRGLTVLQFAELLGVSVRAVARMERGEMPLMDDETINNALARRQLEPLAPEGELDQGSD